MLAEQAGLLKPLEELPKKEQKSLREKLGQVTKKHLGDGFEVLSERLAEILTETLEDYDAEATRRLEESQALAARRVQETEYNHFIAANKVTEAEMKQISKLADKFAPPQGASLSSYLGDLLQITRGQSLVTERRKNNVAKMPTNKGVEGNESPSGTVKVKVDYKKLTPKQLVELAAQGKLVEG
jgi:type I site-specific restriction-modification system R (restriction) subunit